MPTASPETSERRSDPSLASQVLSVLNDQFELADLELRYERSQFVRQLAALLLALVLGGTYFVLLQIAMVHALVLRGHALGHVCLVLGGIYGLLAGVIYRVFGQRDPRAGEPFEASRKELGKNLKWIQKLFS